MYKQKIQAYDKLVAKLTSQLEKNIAKNNQQLQHFNRRSIRLGSNKILHEEEYNQVINLYEDKMINMGEEILRIRKDKDAY